MLFWIAIGVRAGVNRPRWASAGPLALMGEASETINNQRWSEVCSLALLTRLPPLKVISGLAGGRWHLDKQSSRREGGQPWQNGQSYSQQL